MVFYLTDYEKILIIITASSLFLLSVIITTCFVSPICLLNKWLLKICTKVNPNRQPKQQIITAESKHFQLKVVPLYGTSTDGVPNGAKKQERKSSSPTGEKKKASSRRKSMTSMSSCESTDKKHSFISAEISFSLRWTTVDESSVKLHLFIKQVTSLQLREYGIEPASYVTVDLSSLGGISRRRRSNLVSKGAISFRTATAKRSLSPVFNESFSTSELPKSILKTGRLKFRVISDERYANDCCLGELNVPLKKIVHENEDEATIEVCNLMQPKESKGEILFGLCYLPTSRRVTMNISKVSLSSQPSGSNSRNHYYVRVLMFINGKLNRKKRTSSSEKLTWSDEETVTFDLTNSNPEDVSFMLVLSTSKEALVNGTSSPSSPESPELPSASSKKERHVGHFIVGKAIWEDMKQQPRKQISLCARLS